MILKGVGKMSESKTSVARLHSLAPKKPKDGEDVCSRRVLLQTASIQ